jgi:hypothetical protein
MRKQTLFSFNLKDPTVYREQFLRLREETGLDAMLLRDLAKCPLEANVARLLFYTHRISQFVQEGADADLIAEYLHDYVYTVLVPPPNPAEFWTNSRRRYLRQAKELRARVEVHWRRGYGQAAEDLGEFLRKLREDWGI